MQKHVRQLLFAITGSFFCASVLAISIKSFPFPEGSSLNDHNQPYTIDYQANPGWLDGSDPTLVLNLCLNDPKHKLSECVYGFTLLQPASGVPGRVVFDRAYLLKKPGQSPRDIVPAKVINMWGMQIMSTEANRLVGTTWTPKKYPNIIYMPGYFSSVGWKSLPLPEDAKEYGLKVEMAAANNKGMLSIIGACAIGPEVIGPLNMTVWNEVSPGQFNMSSIKDNDYTQVQAIESGYSGEQWLINLLGGGLGEDLVSNNMAAYYQWIAASNSYKRTVRNYTFVLASNEAIPQELSIDVRNPGYVISSHNGGTHAMVSDLIKNPTDTLQGRRILGKNPAYAINTEDGNEFLFGSNTLQEWFCSLNHLKKFNANHGGEQDIPVADHTLGIPYCSKDTVLIPVLPASEPNFPGTEPNGAPFYLVTMTHEEYSDFAQECRSYED